MAKKSELKKYKKEWEREKRKGTVIGPRFFDDELALIDTACAKEDLSRSAFVKRAVLKALHNTNEQE